MPDKVPDPGRSEHRTQSLLRFRAVTEKPPTGVEKLLSFFADVRSGEGGSTLLLTLNVFLLLFAYYLLKTVREALILTEGGAYVKAYSSAGQAALLMGLIPFYSYVASKVVRIRLLLGLLLFFISNLVLFYLFGVNGAQEGVVFYIWVGIFNVFVISQVWAFANDIYTEAQGKRLFPLIGIGSSVGAWLGAQGAERLVDVLHFSPYQIQLLAAALLLGCGGLLVFINQIATSKSDPEMARHAEEKLAPGDGFAMVFRDRYLTWIAILIVLLNLVNSTGEFLLGDLVSTHARELFPTDPAAQKQFVGGFYGSFFAGVNLLGLIVQMFAVSRVLAVIGVRGALYIMPTISLVGYSLIGLVPVLSLVRWTKTLENATDYSLQNTLRQALFLPTSREAKYKAKAAIDTFFMRFGDVLNAGVVRLGAQFHLAFSGFAWVNVGFTLLWIYTVSRLARQHKSMKF